MPHESYGRNRMSAVAHTQIESFLSSPGFEVALTNDDGLTARQHLSAGRPIYYGDPRYPEGLVKKYPDGRKQLVAVNSAGEVSIIRDI